MKTLTLIVIVLLIVTLALAWPARSVAQTEPNYRIWFPLVNKSAPIFAVDAPPLPVCEIDDQPACATPTLAVPPTEVPPTAYP